jgi:hypothetical protein
VARGFWSKIVLILGVTLNGAQAPCRVGFPTISENRKKSKTPLLYEDIKKFLTHG